MLPRDIGSGTVGRFVIAFLRTLAGRGHQAQGLQNPTALVTEQTARCVFK